MVNTDKVYLMTKAALYEKKEAKNAIRVVQYRRQDYILSRMLLVLLSATIAYGVLVGTILFMIIMANDTIVLNVAQMVIFVALVLAGYAFVLIFYYIVSHKYYGDKHVKARQSVRNYLSMLQAIDEINE